MALEGNEEFKDAIHIQGKSSKNRKDEVQAGECEVQGHSAHWQPVATTTTTHITGLRPTCG